MIFPFSKGERSSKGFNSNTIGVYAHYLYAATNSSASLSHLRIRGIFSLTWHSGLLGYDRCSQGHKQTHLRSSHSFQKTVSSRPAAAVPIDRHSGRSLKALRSPVQTIMPFAHQAQFSRDEEGEEATRTSWTSALESRRAA